MNVTRELFHAPPEGCAAYAEACYARTDGVAMLNTIRYEAVHYLPDGGQIWYAPRIFRRRSEDNGRTWSGETDLHRAEPGKPSQLERYHCGTFLHPGWNRIVSLMGEHEVNPSESTFGTGNRVQRTYRTLYQLSGDGGRTWTAARQIFDGRPGYDAEHWGPDLRHGTTGGVVAGQPVFMPDGTLVIGIVIFHPKAPLQDRSDRARELYSTVCFARGRLADSGDRIEWELGDSIHVEFPKAAGGCCEPALLHLNGQRLIATLRCQGDEATGIYATRWSAVSGDGGRTWGPVFPLSYEDGSTVWTPASVHSFFTSSKTGKTYVLANILDHAVHAQTPRYPLTIAEFDTTGCRVLKKTVRVIQDLPPGAPVERRYTNWGFYEERGTGDLVMLLPEQPKYMNFSDMKRPEDYTADCLRYRIRLT